MTVQVGNPSFLYEEMLDDYDETNADPELKSIQEEKVFNWEKDLRRKESLWEGSVFSENTTRCSQPGLEHGGNVVD